MAAGDGVQMGEDGVPRCWWCGDDPVYVAYHDEEWGRPVRDEPALFERLALESFQAGLAWITILRKRPAFVAAFGGFDVDTVAAFGDADVARLLDDAGIVRHRGKIEATIALAGLVRAMRGEAVSFPDLVWAHAPARPRSRPRCRSEIPGTSPEAEALSVELKRRGAKFVGPTIVHAFLQSAGVVDDHVVGCHRAVA